MIYKMALKDSADEMTFDLLEVPIVDKDIEGAVDNVTLDGNQYTDYLWLKKQFIQKWSILCDDEYTRLRGFYTRQFENADVPSYRLYYGDDIIRNSTLSGERIELSISGVADGTMSLTQMDGNIEQATYTGKNLLHVTKASSTDNGVTFTVWSDGTVTTMGTATALVSINLILGQNSYSLPAGTYTLSGCPTGGSDSKYRIDINNGADGDKRDYGNGATFTLTGALSVSNVRIRVASGTNMNGLTFKPMIESGNQPTAYEPFVGGQPSPSPSYPQPIQTVTGRQTITVTGKNLYDTATTIFSDPSKVDVQVDGDTLKMTALENTTSGDLFIRTPIPDGLLENGKTYTISCVLGSGASKKLRLQLRNRDGSNAGFSNGYSITYDDRYVLFVVENPFGAPNTLPVSAGTVCVISNIQVEEGGSETTFESFHEQEQEINLGKNLWDTTVENGFIDNSGTQQSSTNQMRTVGYIELAQNTAYTFSNTNGLVVDRVCYYDGAKTFIERSAYINNKTFTTTSTNFQLARIVIRATNSGNISPSDLAEPQLEKGYDATAYASYITPIELCKIGTYQDRIYKTDGKWYIEKQVGKATFDGSENWQVIAGASITSYGLDNALSGDYHSDTTATYLANNFKTISVNDRYVDNTLFINALHRVVCTVSSITSLASFKTWLASNPTTVYYVLATPTTTEITNEALVEELEALVDEAISVGQHNIYTDTPNALPTLTFDLTEYLSKSTTIIPETAVRLTLTDGGVINACGCRKDVQLTMRETIE